MSDPDKRTTATWWAVMLARDLDACRMLLRGEPVDPARLRPEWVERARGHKLVSLDVAAIDLLKSRKTTT